MLKLVNPFDYPTAILIGGLSLIAGVRFLGIPNLIILPTAAVVATGSAVFLKSREPYTEKIARQQLEKELQQIKILAQGIVSKSEILLKEANQSLTLGDFQLNLLVAVQTACDRINELPAKIDQLSRKISFSDSLLSSEELEKQLQEIQKKIPLASGVAKQELEQLAMSLERNIKLAKTGKDTRQAQILNLHTLVQNSAGILQELQNKLRTSNLNNSEDIRELQELSQELKQIQENVNTLLY
jgi:Na+/phosphate symporter